MSSYHIEIVNIDQSNIPLKKYTACTSVFTIPIFLIPGVETPFKNLGLNHNEGGFR